MSASHQNPLNLTPVFSVLNTRNYTGAYGDYRSFTHRKSMELTDGTISFGFSIDRLQGDVALLSKDGSGRENGGHFTIWVKEGQLVVSHESSGTTQYMKVPELLETHTDYHLAMSFGSDGLMLWLNGQMVAAEPTFEQGIELNSRELVVGGSRSSRGSDSEAAHSLLRGSISDLMIFDRALAEPHIISLAGAIDPAIAMDARMVDMMSDLAPVLDQLHHGSDTLKKIMADYGIDHHGHMNGMMKRVASTGGDDVMTGSGEADMMDGGKGNDDLTGGAGNDIMQGGYGNDVLNGSGGNDILDGGHGEDRLVGGAGNDLLISRADAREPDIYPDPNRDEGDPLNELTNGKLYPNQPIPGDDLLIGGNGADIFYFQTLINAKERYIEKHTRDDGTINWHGVAGENDKLHDHWVDMLGNDVVYDYSRLQGDRLVIEGHTTQIDQVTYGDSNGDGILDFSLIELYSDQGNGGGAHNDDRLGTITVYGDLVRMSDIEHTAAPAYGIIASIEDLDEALAPLDPGTDTGPIAAPRKVVMDAAAQSMPFALAPVVAVMGRNDFTGQDDDYMNVGDSGAMDLKNGTVSLGFSLDQVPGSMALISKDGSGRDQGGQFTLWVNNGLLELRFESATESRGLYAKDIILSAHTDYHVAFTFGDDGLSLWLNGELVAAEPTFKQGIDLNTRAMVIGGTRAWRSSDSDAAHSLLKGSVTDVMVYDRVLTEGHILTLATDIDPALSKDARMADMMSDLAPILDQAHHGSDTLKDILSDYGLGHSGHMTMPMNRISGSRTDDAATGTNAADSMNGGRGDDDLTGGGGNDIMQGGYGNDMLTGNGGDDILDGGHGEDRLIGGAGNDLLISRADAREPDIYPDPNRDEGDPLNELTNGKLYPNQPIPGDDLLIGGTGADIFYFQTLINAKQRYIEKHTRDDGTINWHGVAGENDKLHDHWVDMLGNDVIYDFSRAEGDRIVIEGHTTQIDSITYGDANSDGVLDYSLIELYSDQGKNGGAHNDDRLGTIKVYGDLVRKADIEHTAGPAYGIVTTIDDLNEALAPLDPGTEGGRIKDPTKLMPDLSSLDIAGNWVPVWSVANDLQFDAADRSALLIGHSDALDLRRGTIAMTFEADSLTGTHMLFSKDASGYGNGGHLTGYVDALGGLTVRFQDDQKSHYFEADFAIDVGKSYDFAFSFGPNGAAMYLNGAKVAYDSDLTIDLNHNTEAMAIGASIWSSTPGTTDNVHSYFDGTISDVMVFDRQLTSRHIFGNEARADTLKFAGSVQQFQFTQTNTGDIIVKGAGVQKLAGSDIEFLAFNDVTVRTIDINFGSVGSEYLSGRDGADVLLGDAGDDKLKGYDNDDLIRGGTGDDELRGGKGNDFLFGQNGADYLYGGDGNDYLKGGDGKDYLIGGDGNDRFWGSFGDDYFYGNDWHDGGNDRNDRVFFNGDFSDYSFSTESWYDSNRGETVQRLVVTDRPSGGSDGYYEGVDRLLDIDYVVFADQTVAVTDLL